MNSTATNHPRFFYKYMSACTARKVLDNRTLRWSAPERFNDPFDIHPEPIQLDGDELRLALLEVLSDNRDEVVRHDPRLKCLLETPSNEHLDDLKHFWRDHLSNMRVLCVSEVVELTAMWAHYADSATGVALQFEALDSPENPFRAAVPVVYTDRPPPITNPQAWARLMIRSLDWHSASVNSFFEYQHTKTTEWEAEKEWRISSMKRPGEKGQCRDYPYDGRELSAVYFGWKCTEDDRAAINSLLSHRLDHVKAFNTYANLTTRRYEFKEIPRA